MQAGAVLHAFAVMAFSGLVVFCQLQAQIRSVAGEGGESGQSAGTSDLANGTVVLTGIRSNLCSRPAAATKFPMA